MVCYRERESAAQNLRGALCSALGKADGRTRSFHQWKLYVAATTALSRGRGEGREEGREEGLGEGQATARAQITAALEAAAVTAEEAKAAAVQAAVDETYAVAAASHTAELGELRAQLQAATDQCARAEVQGGATLHWISFCLLLFRRSLDSMHVRIHARILRSFSAALVALTSRVFMLRRMLCDVFFASIQSNLVALRKELSIKHAAEVEEKVSEMTTAHEATLAEARAAHVKAIEQALVEAQATHVSALEAAVAEAKSAAELEVSASLEAKVADSVAKALEEAQQQHSAVLAEALEQASVEASSRQETAVAEAVAAAVEDCTKAHKEIAATEQEAVVATVREELRVAEEKLREKELESMVKNQEEALKIRCFVLLVIEKSALGCAKEAVV